MKAQAKPLSWILVLVGGTIFLLFFIALIKVMLTGNQEKEEAITLRGLQNTISSITTNSITIKNLPEAISSCKDHYELTYKKNSLDFKEAIFSTKKIGGKSIIWSKELFFPYPTIKISYVIPKQTIVIINNNGQPPIEGDELFPDNITYTTDINTNSITLSDYKTVVLISLDDLKNMRIPGVNTKYQEVYGLRITPIDENRMLEGGNITFYKYNNDRFQIINYNSSYIDKSTLLGAIFSGGRTRYECGLRVINKKMNLLAEINKKRINEIAIKTPDYCPYDSDLNDSFDILKNKNIITTNIQNLIDNKEFIRIKNNRLSSLNCPPIY